MGFSRQEHWSGFHFLLQGIFLTQESNLHLLHGQVDSLPQRHQGSPWGCVLIRLKANSPQPTKSQQRWHFSYSSVWQKERHQDCLSEQVPSWNWSLRHRGDGTHLRVLVFGLGQHPQDVGLLALS